MTPIFPNTRCLCFAEDIKAKLDAFEAAILAASDGAHTAISDN